MGGGDCFSLMLSKFSGFALSFVCICGNALRRLQHFPFMSITRELSDPRMRNVLPSK